MMKWNCVQFVFPLCVLALSLASCSVVAEKYRASIVDYTWSSSFDSTSSVRVHDKGHGRVGGSDDRKLTHAVRMEGSCALSSPSVDGKVVRYASKKMFSRNQVHTDFFTSPVSGDVVLEVHSYESGKAEHAIDVFTDEYYFIEKDVPTHDIDIISCDNVRVKATSGDVELIIGQVNGKSWTASSASGTIRVDGKTNGESFFGSRSRSGRVNGGGPTSVHVSSVSGDVTDSQGWQKNST
eukprot:Nk52_evm6s254 gene=Nk52_evmTU6s254